ncbi:MAG: hypothetical protein V7K25_18685 [Nostoc sp.]|uniref:hypothetical protein n=1 Tax=Nostoc sp. TaxID=1180 RepID=UPI002FF71D88
MDDFALLALGNSTSLITNVQVVLWGKEVYIDCVYNPDKRLPYRFVFYNCREIKWNLLFPEDACDVEADIIDFFLGKENYLQPALFHTDIFQITILYGSFKLEKNW